MTRYDWAVVIFVGLAALFTYFRSRRVRPPKAMPTAKEIAREVVIASNEAQMTAQRKATVRCGRCTKQVPEWFVEDFGSEMKEKVCLKCSQDMPYPDHEQIEDDYVAEWRAARDARREREAKEAELGGGDS